VTWVLLALAIATEVGATLALRAHAGSRRAVWVWLTGAGYVASFVLLGLVLAGGLPVGIVYAVWAALGVAATAVLGRALFHDGLPRVAIVGIGVIIIGVVLLEVGTTA
jgi:small multidrug resistance pump